MLTYYFPVSCQAIDLSGTFTVNPPTHFKVEVVLGKTLSPATRKLLALMCTHPAPELSFLLENFKIPDHPFFHLPNWHLVFSRTRVFLDEGPDRTCRLMGAGRTDLEEQDIGLFLRWTQQHLCATSVYPLPETLAIVRSEARPADGMWLEYRIDKSDLLTPMRQDFVYLGNFLG